MDRLAANAEAATDARHTAQVRELAEILRSILVVAVTAIPVSLVFAGVGGRLVMRAATLLSPESIGARTENGNRIGEITLDGSIALVIFGSLTVALVGTVLWVTVRPWLPVRRIVRAASAAVVAVAVAGFFLVDPYNPDFLVLRSDLAIVALFLVIIALFGFGLAWFEPVVDRRIRHPGADPIDYTVAAIGLVILGGLLALPVTVPQYLSNDACLCSVSPVPLGVPLAIAGVATLVSWIRRIRGEGASPIVTATGRLAVVAMVTLGGAILVTNIRTLPL